LLFETENSERMRIDSSGNAIFTKPNGAYLQLKDASVVRGAINVETSDGLVFTTGSSFTERMRIGPAGQIGIGGANYGTSGQVLTSNGSGSAPSWQDAGAGSSNWTLSGNDIYNNNSAVN